MNSIKIFLILIFLGLTIGACETFTDPNPDNQYPYSRIIKEAAFAEGLVTYGYIRMPQNYDMNDVATDDAVSNDKSNTFLRLATGEWSPLFNPLDEWSNDYGVIWNLNKFLTLVKDVQWSWQNPIRNALFIKRFTGEAYALRGYFYMQLLMKYGGISTNGQLLGVPLILTPVGIDDNWKVPRNTYQDCLDQIIKDFDSATVIYPGGMFLSGNLPEIYKDSVAPTGETIPQRDIRLAFNKVYGAQGANRIQGQIIKALKGKLYLVAGSPAFNNGSYDVAKCTEAAKILGQLLVKYNKGTGGTFPPDQIIWDADGDITNLDLLWRNNYANSNTLESASYPPSIFGNGRVNPTQNLVEAFPARNGYPITDPLSLFSSATPYANRDLRLDRFILRNGMTVRSTYINTCVNSTTNDGLNKLPAYSTRTGYYLAKFMRFANVNMNPASITSARHFYTNIRWTEIYLNYAEAANEAWGPTADPNGYGFTPTTILRAIRNRAGITPAADPYLYAQNTQVLMRNLIRNERRLELCFEGQRFWDLRRWNLNLKETAKGVAITDLGGGNYSFTNIDVENRNFNDESAYFMPIPQTEILKYGDLVQNKGW